LVCQYQQIDSIQVKAWPVYLINAVYTEKIFNQSTNNDFKALIEELFTISLAKLFNHLKILLIKQFYLLDSLECNFPLVIEFLNNIFVNQWNRQ